MASDFPDPSWKTLTFFVSQWLTILFLWSLGEERTVRGCCEELFRRPVTRKLPLDQRQVIIKGKKAQVFQGFLIGSMSEELKKPWGPFILGIEQFAKMQTASI
jgi:hypothetical protein